jgi:glutamyl-tRNA synthetase
MPEKALVLLSDETRLRLGRLRDAYAATADWEIPALEALNREFAEKEGVGIGKFGPALRACLSGGSPAPDLAGALVALGKSESLGRLDDALSLVR